MGEREGRNELGTRRGRVLVVTSNFPRWEGDSTTPFVRHLCEDLTDLGWDIEVLAPHAPGAALEERLGNLRVSRFRYAWPDAAQTVCYQGGALVNLRRRRSEKWKLPLLVAAEWAAVQARLQGGDYDLVHSHWMLPQGFVAGITAWMSAVPHVLTVHGGDLFALRGPTLERFKRFSLGSADVVTVNSSFTEAETRKLAPTHPSVVRIPMGVRLDPIGDEERKLASFLRGSHRGAGPLAIFVGRLVEEKGGAEFVRAIAALRARDLDARGLVIGSGPERAALEELATTLGASAAVCFVGWIQPDQVRAHLLAADVFVGPSKRASDGWVEAQGLTFLEAMAAGVPVVASRSGGIVDAVVDRETGLLTDEGDVGGLTDAIQRLFSDPLLANRLADAGRLLVEREFARPVVARRFSDRFAELIERRGRR